MDTFKIMWDMSAPGSEAAECFLRLKQTEIYKDEGMGVVYTDAYKNMPDVSSHGVLFTSKVIKGLICL